MGGPDGSISKTWRSVHGDLTDEEWELIADLVPSYSGPGRVGRPTKWSKRDIVSAIADNRLAPPRLRSRPHLPETILGGPTGPRGPRGDRR